MKAEDPYPFFSFKKEAETIPLAEELEEKEEKVLQIPQFNVVLHDDQDHTYDYVIEMLTHIFSHSLPTAFNMACEVDATGRVIVFTTHKEHAELKRDQIINYGPDWRLQHSISSMRASIEQA